jgi:ribosomal protein L11 methyltransferase
VTAPGLKHRAITTHGPYELIVANILSGPLVALAPAIGRAAAHGANVVLSGLLVTQAARVANAYLAQGLVLRRKLIRGDWATLVLEKP